MALSMATVHSTAVPAATCVHHWVIESPGGAISRGVCKHCGVVREFRNSVVELVWEEERQSAVRFWEGTTLRSA
ncbi:MAG: hypothetical protein HY689_11215 [Chloroflexi bacterium]|nr:hypothetical protein [Chloroflexota bacterium]